MKTFCSFLVGVMVLICSVSAFSGEFKVYPGATLDERATKDANDKAKEANLPTTIKTYTTDDAFEKVVDFYKGVGTEVSLPAMPGRNSKLAFFIFDDAPDLASSKQWAKIQRPVKVLYKEDVEENKTRDITAIVLVEKLD